MATTTILTVHVNKGKTPKQCVAAQLNYIMNPASVNCLTATSVSQITADLCPVIAFQGGRGVEQGHEQVLLDIPYFAARFLHAVKNVFDVMTGQGPESFFHQLGGDLAPGEGEGIAAGSQYLQDQGNNAVKGLLTILLPKLVIADIEPHLGSEPFQVLRQMRAF